MSEYLGQTQDHSGTDHRRQVFFETRTKRSMFTEMARSRHAVFRVRNATRYHYQSSCLSQSNDDRYVCRESSRQSRCSPRPSSRCNAIQVLLIVNVKIDFRFSEENTAADYFGEQLLKAGYNYHGNEPMYSGVLGTELNADIYIGCVFYQRLRHMVNDKFQVRTTGPVHSLTQQPIKGRKRFGGIRFGEMERDSMIAHGTSFLLKDRLMNCSDYTQSWICRDCGSVLSSLSTISGMGGAGAVRCKSCAVAAEGFETLGEVWEDGGGLRWKGGENVAVVTLPYVFKYLSSFISANS